MAVPCHLHHLAFDIATFTIFFPLSFFSLLLLLFLKCARAVSVPIVRLQHSIEPHVQLSISVQQCIQQQLFSLFCRFRAAGGVVFLLLSLPLLSPPTLPAANPCSYLANCYHPCRATLQSVAKAVEGDTNTEKEHEGAVYENGKKREEDAGVAGFLPPFPDTVRRYRRVGLVRTFSLSWLQTQQ